MLRFLEILVFSGYIFGSTWFSVAYFQLKKQMRSSNDPMLALSRRERRKRARKLLQRQDDAYEQQMIERLTKIMKGENIDEQ